MKKAVVKLMAGFSPFLLLEAVAGVCVNVCFTRGNSIISSLVEDLMAGIAVDYRGLVLVFTGLVVAGAAASFVRRFSAGVFANKVCSRYRSMVFEKLYRIEYRYLVSNHTGTLLNKMIGDIGIVENFLDVTLPDISANLMATVIYAVYIADLNVRIFILMMVSYPLIFWIANLFVSKMKKLAQTYREKADAMTDIAQDAVSGILTVRAFGLEEIFRKRMDAAADDLVENEQKRTGVSNTTMVIRQMLQWLPNIICALYAAYLVSRGVLSLGNLLAFVLILGRFVECFTGLPFMFVEASVGMVGIDRIENILAWQEEENGQYRGGDTQDVETVIEFANVGFAYEKDKVLDGIDLTVRKYDNVALTGESGGGKSTMVSLLCGLYDNYDGDIRLWGRSIREWDKGALRDQISLVSQDIFLFPMSIEENVAFGLAGATHEDVVKACKEANIHEFIESLPEGFGTVIGEKGMNLSGGQKQRLSIARAILKNAPILIMDEPTSSIDVKTENEIQKEIEKLRKNKTCITIAHRLNTIKDCNHVYRLDGGKLGRA